MAADREPLAPWRDHPESAAVLTDFDGTLSPIVADPEAARPLPGAAAVMARLAQRYRVVAVISGRPVAYLLEHLGSPPGVTLVGLYGLETRSGLEQGAVVTLAQARRWREVVAAVAAAAEAEAPAGVYVERKGLAVGLHVRRAPAEAAWVEAWADDQARRSGLVVHVAKMSRELVPPVETDKGMVIEDLTAGLGAVCYLGDDVGDLAAFDALERLAAAGIDTLAVAVRSDESPPALLARADLIVDGPEGALALLNDL